MSRPSTPDSRETPSRIDDDLYRLVFDSLTEHAIAVLSPAGVITHWNSSAARLTGYEGSEIVGRSWASIYAIEEQLNGQLNLDLNLAREGSTAAKELWHVRRDGQGYWARQVISSIRRNGQVSGYSVVFEDQTEQRRQNCFWRDTAEQLRSLLENSSHEFYVHDEQARFIDVNRTACENLGYTREELLSLTVMDVEVDIDFPMIQTVLNQLTVGESHLVHGRHRRKSGSIYPVEVYIKLIELEGKRLVIAESRDMTERLERAAQLAREQERFRKIVDAMPGLICSFRMSPDGHASMPFISSKSREFYGVDPHEIATDFSPVMTKIHPDDVLTVQRTIVASAETMTPWSDEYRYLHPTRGLRWYSGHSMPVREPDGSILWHGTIVDVTERRLAEQALAENTSRLQLALATAQIGVWDWTFATNAVFWSPECFTINGLTEFDNTLDGFIKTVHPDDLAHVFARVQAAIAGHTEYSSEFRTVRPDGEVRWVTNLGRVEYDERGQPVRMLGTIRDISEVKHAAEALAQSEARLRSTFDNMIEGCQILDFDLRYLYLNDKAAQQGRLTREKMLGKTIREVYPGVEQTAVYKSLEQSVRTRVSIQMETEFFFPDGSSGIFELSVQPVPEGIAIMSVDITERKRAGEQLRASEQRYRELLTFLPEAIFVQADFKINFCNPAFLRLVGATNEADVLGKSPLDFIPRELHDLVRERIHRMRDKNVPVPAVRYDWLRLDGTRVPVAVSAAPYMDRGQPSFVVSIQDFTDLRRAEHEVRRNTERFRTLVQASSQNVWFADPQFSLTNSVWSEFTGLPTADISGEKFLQVVHPDDHTQVATIMATVLREPRPIQTEFRIRRADGQWRVFQTQVAPLFNDQGTLTEWIGASNDVTEQRQLAAQLAQSQRLESLGRLAGGVAHDFNNLLTVIGIHTHLLNESLEEHDQLRNHLHAVVDAADRAAGLTRQLLAFSRQQISTPKAIDVTAAIGTSVQLLRRLIGEDITLVTRLADDLPLIHLDPTQLAQVVMNLAVNARDAMPSGGQLAIETSRVELAQPNEGYPGVEPGQYVRLSVADTGCGMSNEVRSRIFEPFFTTKGVGYGTGLGLAVVHGIVEQAHGAIFVHSMIDQGTTIEILFRPEVTAVITPAPINPTGPTRGVETVLLAEDEGAVRRVARMILERHGYQVIEACDGAEALRLAHEHADEVQLLLTDVVMPHLNGPQLAAQLARELPQLKVVYMSGYLNDRANRDAIINSGSTILEKPFKPKDLVRAVRDALDQNIERHTT
ncbi:MAG: PAS domain S-box protein [Planctomycetaceae bacterium]|nr:PAS domain S-box protein [Planctomycetaceae bacterium]